MKHKLISEGPERTYAIVLDVGDEPVSCLTGFAKAQRLDAARFTGIGAFSEAVVGFFDLQRQDYEIDSDRRAGRSRFAGRRCRAGARRRAEAARPCGARQARRLGLGRASDRGARAADLGGDAGRVAFASATSDRCGDWPGVDRSVAFRCAAARCDRTRQPVGSGARR